jgi:hypothetical protein
MANPATLVEMDLISVDFNKRIEHIVYELDVILNAFTAHFKETGNSGAFRITVIAEYPVGKMLAQMLRF